MRVGVSVDREPLWVPAASFSPSRGWTSTPGRSCAAVQGVFVFARPWANFSKKAKNIYRFEVETQTGKAL